MEKQMETELLQGIDFDNISFDGIEELEEIVTPGHGSLCCC